MESITQDPFAQFSLFIMVFTLGILALFFYLNRIAVSKVREEKKRQLKVDEDKLRVEIRENLIKQFDKDQSLKMQDMQSDLRQKKSRVTSLVYKLKNVLQTMSSEKIVKEVGALLTQHFPAGRLLILLRSAEDNSILLNAGGRGENLPDVDQIRVADLPVVQMAMSKGIILSKEDAHFQLQTLDRTELGLEPALTVPLLSVTGGLQVSQGAVLILDMVGEPDQDDMTLLGMIASLTGTALNNAMDLESSKKLSEDQLREKKRLTSLFSKYVSPNVVDALIAGSSSVNLGGEEARVAIFFADIRHFTTMAEGMHPTQVVNLLNEYFHEMNQIIFRWNGTLDKYMGDAIMALFGAPVSALDDCLRAVGCGLEMQSKLKEMNEVWRSQGKPMLHIGVGINFGTVVVGNIGGEQRMEYTAIGDRVNVASRLCSMARPGQVLITDDVFMEGMESMDVKRLDPIQVKGREEPVQIYEVIRII